MNAAVNDAMNASAGTGIPVRNPRTGATDYLLHAADATAVAAEAARLRSAQPAA